MKSFLKSAGDAVETFRETGIKIDHILTKYDGQPFYPADICTKVKNTISFRFLMRHFEQLHPYFFLILKEPILP